MRTYHRYPYLGSFVHIVTSLYSHSNHPSVSKAFIHKIPSTPIATSNRFSVNIPSRNNHFMSSSSTTDIGPSSDDIRKRKQDLRKRIRSAMKDLSIEDINTQSHAVWKSVFELPIYQSAKSVGLFLSMPKGEINTDLILQHCVQEGKDIYVPEVGKNFELCDMELRKVILNSSEATANSIDYLFHKQWPTNKWNIPEPPADMPTITANPGDIDLMIVPGLAFDRTRNRLGQGKGYYDRFIEKMTKDRNSLPLVAVALKPQLVEDTSIPVAPYDQRMDMLVLPDEVIAAVD